MNIKDYISSGILETYLLGLAGEEETRELEELCLKYPELKTALQEAEMMMEQYAQLNAVMPPVDTREQIWTALQNDHVVSSKTNEIVSSKRGISKLYPYITAAAVFLLIMGIPYHYYKMSKYQEEISTLKQEKTEILVQNKNFEARIKQTADEINILTSARTRRMNLTGVPGYEEQQATLLIADQGQLFINASALSKLPAAQQYQLWAIVKGKPVNAGLVDQTEAATLQKMLMIENAEMYAITIEKRGGSDQPTLTKMVVAGKVL